MITQLLGSKHSTDVIESLQFLTSAFEFGLKGAPEAVRKSLALVWSPEPQICEALVVMYKKLFLRFVHADNLTGQLLYNHCIVEIVKKDYCH